MAMLAVLDRLGYGHVTVHGFRATFATWAEECSDYPDGVPKPRASRARHVACATGRTGDGVALVAGAGVVKILKATAVVNTPPPKGGGFKLRLEAGLIDPLGRFDQTTLKLSSGSSGL
jgi:hypothetical protein